MNLPIFIQGRGSWYSLRVKKSPSPECSTLICLAWLWLSLLELPQSSLHENDRADSPPGEESNGGDGGDGGAHDGALLLLLLRGRGTSAATAAAAHGFFTAGRGVPRLGAAVEGLHSQAAAPRAVHHPARASQGVQAEATI